MDTATLKREIEARYGSVYKFLQATKFPRSTAYAVLSGAYPGRRIEAQTLRMRASLAAPGQVGRAPDPAALAEALQAVACNRCKRQDRRKCRGCKALTLAQAEAIAVLFRPQGG